METMNIALPDSMKEYVQEQVAKGGYSSISEYMRDLIRADQRSKQREAVEAEILEGLRSGDPSPMAPEDWAEIRREVRRRRSPRETA